MIKTLLTFAAIALFATTGIAQNKTDTFTIAGGLGGGGYNNAANRMSVKMGQRGYTDVKVSENNGSDAITLAACNGNADIWIAQVDAIYTRFQEGCVLYPVADYGTEVAVLLVPADSNIDELSDLDSSTAVAVDGIGSGTELFWITITNIENGEDGSKDEWAKAVAVESAPEMLNTMANFGDIQAAILVRKVESDHIKLLLDQGWQIVELWDKDINDLEFNGLPLYESTVTSFMRKGKTIKEYTYGVRSFIGVTKENSGNRKFKMDVAASTQ